MDSSLFLKNAADKCGFERVRYNSNSVPTSIDPDNVCVLSFFGDNTILKEIYLIVK